MAGKQRSTSELPAVFSLLVHLRPERPQRCLQQLPRTWDQRPCLLRILLKALGFQGKPTSCNFQLLWQDESLVSFEFKKINKNVYFYTGIVELRFTATRSHV